MADLDRTREALRAAMTAWAVAEVRGDQARVTPSPDPDQLALHLERVDPGWSLQWACDSVTPPVVRARLNVLGAVREGLATGHTLNDAKLRALADAARFFGVPLPTEAQWVEYDPEDGPNTADLDAEAEGVVAPTAGPASRAPEPPRDPQMEKARRHIEDLIEQLKAAGKGGEATRVLLRGYGETVEESRAIYKELQAILRG
ncbi:DNA single-strand annealing protein, containing HHH motif, Rad42/Rad22/RecT/erf family [Deinococcus aerius]|uniref:DNA single-strand annealing protein, containing HHH motif, Rad42/Rad22/RecT/erf family n=1 Tax=Deinococcus aerius TaxID=200253 RepID=A0A2I9CYL4_9DEIO|nr:single-stranded DNA-binding protein [Deinococcus aerius]GBF07252.1 DNA single-strand annealing protein, containing HHH motif, Rad42/Rad22/RecT/erf family [Deinococcus aerius]